MHPPLSLASVDVVWPRLGLRTLVALEPRTREHHRADAVLRSSRRARGGEAAASVPCWFFGAVTTAARRRVAPPPGALPASPGTLPATRRAQGVTHDSPASERSQLSVTHGLDDQTRPLALAPPETTGKERLTTTLVLSSDASPRKQTQNALPHDREAVHEEDAVVQRHERQIHERGQRPDDPVRLHDPPELFLEGSGRRL